VTAKFEFAHDQNYKLYADGKFYNFAKDDLEKSPLADTALNAPAKAAKEKLTALLKSHEGPRDGYFSKQSGTFSGEQGEDADGNQMPKPAKKMVVKPAASEVAKANPLVARFNERDLNHDGKLDLDEFTATVSHKDGAKARFEKLDSNKDGCITREEFMIGAKN